MTLYQYVGTLTDINLGALTNASPVMKVRPEVEAYSLDGLVSAVPVPVTLDGASFSMTLIPSGELTPTAGGTPGVDYIIEVGRFEESLDGTVWNGTDAWRFTAAAGGGNVGEMNGGSLLAVWLGPPLGVWPAEPLPKGLYLDPITGDGFIET